MALGLGGGSSPVERKPAIWGGVVSGEEPEGGLRPHRICILPGRPPEWACCNGDRRGGPESQGRKFKWAEGGAQAPEGSRDEEQR